MVRKESKMDKVVIVLSPYIFGFLGIMSLINHTYPLWGSISLIVLMAIATIIHIITLAKKMGKEKGESKC